LWSEANGKERRLLARDLRKLSAIVDPASLRPPPGYDHRVDCGASLPTKARSRFVWTPKQVSWWENRIRECGPIHCVVDHLSLMSDESSLAYFGESRATGALYA
jgi:hypothetical protein